LKKLTSGINGEP